ncbi:WYL domain-containing protein [Flavobacterium rhamnosiphilum]|uniref:WYL domain-containing protein n=1 Tax=Flavobacterium rhamnosiphilum TaxID=2541724 RepID=A0A4V2Z9C0_9FLAO|nr:WYL domain-containing protein [Flavobacterium rhamnosiphilum]TDE44398.1 WYL domain-containing protein [Flavobacterium rhamnosiphilum]
MEKDITEHKPLNSTQVAQTSILIDSLKKRPYQKIGQLVVKLGITKPEISERTFYRLIDKLFVIYGIKIRFDYSIGGYFIDEKESSNTESFLSHIEILATAELFTSNFEDKSNPLSLVEFETKAITATIPNFKIVLEAIQKNLPISFIHNSFYHRKEEEYTLKPYFLKQYQNRWYAIGETEKGYRTFGIDRIENITIGTKKFKPKTEEAKEKFSNVIGLNYVDHKLETIKLSFHSSQKPYLESLPLHRSQKEINLENGETFDIELRIHPNFEFRQQILKYGSLVKVLEPKWLAEEIKEEQRKAFERY